MPLIFQFFLIYFIKDINNVFLHLFKIIKVSKNRVKYHYNYQGALLDQNITIKTSVRNIESDFI